MQPAIRLETLSKVYRKGWQRSPVAAVSGVSLEVAPGEAFGFVGPNGAGKSSTIRIIMGLSMPSAGSAEVFGINVMRPEARRSLGYVPESPYLYDYLTPVEILKMSMRLHGTATASYHRDALEWLERLGLESVGKAQIRSFSKGMLQRVAIAQALVIRPRLLVLDEPLSGLDPIGRREVVDLLAGYKKGGGTLFFTSHVLHDVERLADRFGLIHRGELRSVRSPAELVGEDDVVQIRSTGEVEVPGMIMEGASRWTGGFPRTQLWPQLDVLRQSGHQIIEIKPSLSLEAAFLRIVEG